MATIKEAVQSAMLFVSDTYGEEEARTARVEEIESTSIDSRDYWSITLSLIGSGLWAEREAGRPGLRAALGLQPGRSYKTFTVDRVTGETTSMKIREFASQ